MLVVLQGRLEHFGARALLAFIAANDREGTFDAQSDGEHVRLALRDGQVVAGEATGAADPTDVVAKLLQWNDGMFTFLDEVVLPEGAVPVGMEMAELIAAADERLAEARRIVELFPDDRIRFRVANRPPGEINMTAEEFQILFRIGSSKSLAQLKSESGRTAADLYPIIKRLQMTGLVESAGDPDDTAKNAPKGSAAAASVPPDQAPPLRGTVLAPAFVPDAAPPSPPSPPSPPAPPAAPKSSPEPPAAPAPPAPPASTVSAPAPAAAVSAQPQAAASGGPTLSSTEAPLVATLTADDGTMHPLLEETSTIGRTAANAIALRDPSVSAKHARITRSAEGFTIEDIGSRNGTFINSEKLTGKRPLAEGDVVRLGKIILTFNLASEMRRKQSTEREMMK